MKAFNNIMHSRFKNSKHYLLIKINLNVSKELMKFVIEHEVTCSQLNNLRKEDKLYRDFSFEN